MTFEYLHIFGLGLFIGFVLLRRTSNLKNEPPLVPYKYPIIGHTFEYYKDVPGFLKKCHEEYGEIFSLYIWGSVQTYIGNEHYHEIFKKYRDFSFHEAFNDTFPIDKLLNRPEHYFKPVPEYSIKFFQNWNRFAKTMHYEVIKSLDDLIGDGKVIQPPLETIQQILARLFAAAFVGKELCNDDELLNTFANITADLSPWISIPPALNFIYPGLHKKYIKYKFRYLNNPLKTHRKVILSKITPVIEQRIADQNRLGDSWNRPNDLMQDLIEIRPKNHENNVDIESVSDFLMSFIFASVHNTSLTFTQCLIGYVNNPEYHEKLLQEADRIYSENKHLSYTSDIVDKMERLDNFIKETLRINRHYVTLRHKTISPKFTFANGYQIPKDRVVNVITRHIHLDPKTYGSNPEKFNPNHHVNSPAIRPERNFLAFGMGKQVCPGRYLAVNEIKIAMHFMLLKYNIRSVCGNHIETKIRGEYVLVSDEGLIFEKRKDSIM